VLRTLGRMGIHSVAVASDSDRDLSYLRLADEVVGIGPPRAYLSADALIEAALSTRCSALHPGWGFLSENPSFARRCEAARVSFIGPGAATMRAMADQAVARRTMAGLGLAPIPGSEGVLDGVEHAQETAEEMGYPVLLKAVAGGGGRGMRRVRQPSELRPAWAEATAEAASAFGLADLYMERLIENGRHVEFQVLGDGERCVVLGARECSIQRRHQKLIEESPPPGLAPELLDEMADRVSTAVASLGYRGAGTVEMLQDPQGRLWFMEMNTRLQVEHTVTEAVTGLDLVEWQLRIAANQGLEDFPSFSSSGSAIECRLNAEDVADGFRPQPGLITRLSFPSTAGLRVDTHLEEGDRISPHYDSMFAKLIAHGADRSEAIQRMIGALEGIVIEGVPSTRSLHLQVLRHEGFRSGEYHTGFLEENLGSMLAAMETT
jgi:acetyl-CoA carboxylase biotin carboxylase subunit